MTEDEIEKRVRKEFGSDLSVYCAVDPGFVSLVSGLVQGCLAAQKQQYEDVLEDKRRLTRELDIEMNGVEGAAPQASLCDLLGEHRRILKREKQAVLTRCMDFLKAKGACFLAGDMKKAVRP